MSRLIVDAAMVDKLRANGNMMELCDETGQTLGYFYRTSAPGKTRSPFTAEEIQRRRAEKGGRTLTEILKELGAS
jgi:hypothetical protein